MRVLVVGFGSFGSSVARTLRSMGHEVIVVEHDGELVDRYADLASRAVVGDATDPLVLERAGAREADAAVVGTGESLATTILATMALRDLEVERIYAKVGSATEGRALERVGVTETVFPEDEAGVRLAHALVSRNVLEYVELAPGFSMQEMAVPESWVGRSLLELRPRGELGIQVIGIRDALSGELAIPPPPDAKLKPSDSLLLAGSDETLETLSKDDDG
jgi:trk system potassium uptake protein TrkA